MAEFVIKTKDIQEVRTFLLKLKVNFDTVNSKNILLNREFSIHEIEDNLLVHFVIKPIIPNVTFFGLGIMSFITLALAMFDKFYPILFYGLGFLGLLSLAWTKYFFYILLKRSFKKHKLELRLL